jgi:hypothetical protein
MPLGRIAFIPASVNTGVANLLGRIHNDAVPEAGAPMLVRKRLAQDAATEAGDPCQSRVAVRPNRMIRRINSA